MGWPHPQLHPHIGGRKPIGPTVSWARSFLARDSRAVDPVGHRVPCVRRVRRPPPPLQWVCVSDSVMVGVLGHIFTHCDVVRPYTTILEKSFFHHF